MRTGLVALALSLLAAPAVAQEARAPGLAELERSLLQRIDSLGPLVEEARSAATSAKREAVESRLMRYPADTLRIGPLTVVAPRGASASQAESAYRRLWERWSPVLEGAEGALEGAVFAYTAHGDSLLLQPTPGRQVLPVNIASWHSAQHRETAVRRTLENALQKALPGELREWVGRLRLEPLREDQIYRILLVTKSRAARACFEGDASACWEAMGVTKAASPMERWYTAEEARAVVARQPAPPGGSALRRARQACAEEAYEGCWEYLRLSPAATWIPLTQSVRGNLLAFALEKGGRGAFARLIEGEHRAVDERLAAAAGMPADRLVTEWHAAVFAARPDRSASLGLTRWSALFWITLLCGLSLRSTRWRVG